MSAPDARLAQALDLLNQGKPLEAAASLRRLAAARPRDAFVALALGTALLRTGEYEQAHFHAKRALASLPEDPKAWSCAVNALLALGRCEEAAALAADSVRALPDDAELALAHAETLRAAGRYRDALAAAAAASDRFPQDVGARAALASALDDVGRSREAASVFAALARERPDDAQVATLRCASTVYAAGLSPAQAREPFDAYGALLERIAPMRDPPYPQSRDPDRRLRIGFLSPDLRTHPVATFMDAPLRTLDRAQFDIAVYSAWPTDDAVSRRLAALPITWKRVFTLDLNALARVIHTDRVDVLIELSGHTTGHRLPVLHLRPAPVQATYLGFPHTTGVRAVGWRIVDDLTDPPGESESWGCERLARVEGGFLCYRPPDDAPPPAAPQPDSPFVFGSCNSVSKLNEDVVALWARLLRETPGSRLLLKHLALGHEQGRALLAERFEREGVARERLDLRGHSPYRNLLATYNEVDLALDPFPFNGATTTCDALFMGCPVLTIAGDRSCARVGLSLLSRLGEPRLIARDPEDFLARAKVLAAERAVLASIRAGLRERFLASSVCDAAGFGARFGACLRAMWREYCAAHG